MLDLRFFSVAIAGLYTWLETALVFQFSRIRRFLNNDAYHPIIDAQKVHASRDEKIAFAGYQEKSRPAPPIFTANSLVTRILDILEEYRLPMSKILVQPLKDNHIFQQQIARFVALDLPISMVLPAFPFKSANKSFKVLGTLPDKGEETALLHLNAMCEKIEQLYLPGANLHIVSDGLVYNDILGVRDEEVWRYGRRLREIAQEKHCRHIRFSRLRDLIGDDRYPEPTDEETYVQLASTFRDETMSRFLPADFDVQAAIAQDIDINYTYCGYIKFLDTELADTLKGQVMTNSAKRRACKDVAQRMIVRGKAFALAVASRFPNHLRLSIHPSTNTTKISITLVPTTDAFKMTPWHAALVCGANGSMSMQHAGSVSRDTHEVVYENGQAMYFRLKDKDEIMI